VKPISSPVQIGLVAVGYSAVVVFAVASLYVRHQVELQDAVAASGGMFAAGATMLYLFIGCLFLIPTVFLVWTIARFQDLYTAYSRFLLGLSLSAPVCLIVVLLGDTFLSPKLSWVCFFRILESPIILVGMGMSRWFLLPVFLLWSFSGEAREYPAGRTRP
jgi:hypothetical protein